MTSEVTLAEILPKPLAMGQFELCGAYTKLLSGNETVTVVAVTRNILIETARLRSTRMTLKLLDDIHLVTASACGCAAIVSDDRRLGPSVGLKIIGLGPDSLDDIERLTA